MPSARGIRELEQYNAMINPFGSVKNIYVDSTRWGYFLKLFNILTDVFFRVSSTSLLSLNYLSEATVQPAAGRLKSGAQLSEHLDTIQN